MQALNSLGSRIAALDTKTLISGVVSGVVLLAILGLVFFGQSLFGLNPDGVNSFLTGVQESPWAILGVVLLFCALALVGFPQAILFAATVAVFGAWQGSLFAWFATGVSGAMTFFLGHFFGERWVSKVSAGKAQALIDVMRKRGLLASMIVRWTPSAPFIVVNTLCGASGMAYWKFAAGTGLGIIPKLALIAFFTEQLDDMVRFLTSGDPQALVAIGVLAIFWIGFAVFCRWLYRRLRTTSLAGLHEQTEISQSTPAIGGDDERALNAK